MTTDDDLLAISFNESQYNLLASVLGEWIDYDYIQKAGDMDASKHARVIHLKEKFRVKAEMLADRRERISRITPKFTKGQRLVTMVQEEDGSVRQAIP